MLRYALCVVLCSVITANVFLHNPRGSNNRLNAGGRDVNRDDRLFNSQNTKRGGYNVGGMRYYIDSNMPFEWTNQHGCGGPNSDCTLIIQAMCGDMLRDGIRDERIRENLHHCVNKNCSADFRWGMHESWPYYMHCNKRMRNKGLYTADQYLEGKTAKYTRQNPKGKLHGYECAEERDYYPYWEPTPWLDIAILTNDVEKCNYYQSESQNQKSKFYCKAPLRYIENILYDTGNRDPYPSTKEECEKLDIGTDEGKFKWEEVPAFDAPKPYCGNAPESRDNHLGNGRSGQPITYTWKLDLPPNMSCAIRIRYNVTSGEVPADADYNENTPIPEDDETLPETTENYRIDLSEVGGFENHQDALDHGYIFKNQPLIMPLKGAFKNKLKLALNVNTAQVGRTFEDRTHMFNVEERPDHLDKDKEIHNLNVRGKRGNIVETFPAVEYDFVPNKLDVEPCDYVHPQWTGSNTNDGGNDGQGAGRTDRSNLIQLKDNDLSRNYPIHLSEFVEDDIFSVFKSMATIDQVGGYNDQFNDAGTYYNHEPFQCNNEYSINYFSTRNNQFTNREQKGTLACAGTCLNGNPTRDQNSNDYTHHKKRDAAATRARHDTKRGRKTHESKKPMSTSTMNRAGNIGKRSYSKHDPNKPKHGNNHGHHQADHMLRKRGSHHRYHNNDTNDEKMLKRRAHPHVRRHESRDEARV